MSVPYYPTDAYGRYQPTNGLRALAATLKELIAQRRAIQDTGELVNSKVRTDFENVRRAITRQLGEQSRQVRTGQRYGY